MDATTTAPRFHRLRGLVLGALFVFGLWLPLLDSLLGLQAPFELRENRPLALFPAVPRDLAAFASWPRAFEAWYLDHFGFRTTLLRLHSRLLVQLSRSSQRGRVMVGKEGWLYFAPAMATETYCGLNPLTPEELAECGRVLRERAEFCAARGCVYAVVVVPDKQTVYPEHLPDWVKRVGKLTTHDQVSEVARTVPGLIYVDLRAELLAAKRRERLYEVTDSHWNQRGALVADGVLVRALAGRLPSLRPFGEDVVKRTSVRVPGLDLAEQLGLQDAFTEEQLLVHLEGEPELRRTTDVPPSAPPEGAGAAPVATLRDGPGLPRAVVFRDSMFTALQPIFSLHFARCAYYWQYTFDRAVIERERPDLVLEQVVERKLRTKFCAGVSSQADGGPD